jgi:hypothetical protein
MIPFLELIDSYYSTLAIGEPEEKQIDAGKKNLSIFQSKGSYLPATQENDFHFPEQLMVHCFPVGGNKSALSLASPKEARLIVDISQGKPVSCYAPQA